jgi:phosphatidylserine/phosphatidylglycerophosphate/cardiolipin synthase-like enzyme
MKRLPWLPVLLLVFVLSACQPSPQTTPGIDIYFSPKGGCTEAICRELCSAKKDVFVQAYSFTSARIAEALVEAHRRGVEVQVILDKSQRSEKYSSATFLKNAGIPTFIDDKHAIAHNKIMILDGERVLTGSFNFTKSAEEENAENLLVIRSSELAKKYSENWKAHRDHSGPYAAKEQGYSETHNTASREPATAGKYVASKNSAVFHKAGCKGAEKISAKNLVHYATREEAIRAGKKPCPECRP